MKLVWLLLLVIFTLFIWYNSSLTVTTSSHLSSIIAGFVTTLGQSIGVSFEGDLEHIIRKLAHFCEFALVCWLCCKTMDTWYVPKRVANGYILLFCLLVAVIDEYIQFFSPGRASMVKDVLLDFSGSFSLWLCYRGWQFCK